MPQKTWISGETILASDLNTLSQQSIITCTSSTRPASPTEGMTIYQTDTDTMFTYNGSSWIPTALASQSGLVRLDSKSVVNASEVVFDSIFTSTYLNYLVVMAVSGATSTDIIRWQERVGGSNADTAYSWAGAAYYLSAGSGFQNILAGQNLSNGAVGSFDGASGSSGHCVFEIHSPNTSAYTSTTGRFSFATGNTGMYHGTVGSVHYVSTVYNGFRLFVNSGNFTAVTTVYGYRN